MPLTWADWGARPHLSRCSPTAIFAQRELSAKILPIFRSRFTLGERVGAGSYCNRTKFCPAFAHDGYVEAIQASSNADHAVTNALDAIRFSAEGKMPS